MRIFVITIFVVASSATESGSDARQHVVESAQLFIEEPLNEFREKFNSFKRNYESTYPGNTVTLGDIDDVAPLLGEQLRIKYSDFLTRMSHIDDKIEKMNVAKKAPIVRFHRNPKNNRGRDKSRGWLEISKRGKCVLIISLSESAAFKKLDPAQLWFDEGEFHCLDDQERPTSPPVDNFIFHVSFRAEANTYALACIVEEGTFFKRVSHYVYYIADRVAMEKALLLPISRDALKRNPVGRLIRIEGLEYRELGARRACAQLLSNRNSVESLVKSLMRPEYRFDNILANLRSQKASLVPIVGLEKFDSDVFKSLNDVPFMRERSSVVRSSSHIPDFLFWGPPDSAIKFFGTTIVPLHTNRAIDPYSRPRIWLTLSNGQTISAIFDMGADVSTLSIDCGEAGYVDNCRLPDITDSNNEYRYFAFSDETLNIVKVIRESATIQAAPHLGHLELDFHLAVGVENEAARQHLGSGPFSYFAMSFVFGYLANARSSHIRSWLVMGDQRELCAAYDQLVFFPVVPLPKYVSAYWTVAGRVGIGSQPMTSLVLLLDTGGTNHHDLPPKAFRKLIEEIEKDGLSKAILSETGRGWAISNCQNANVRFPSIVLELGSGPDSKKITVTPMGTVISYLSQNKDGSCDLFVRESETEFSIISTHILDQLYVVFDSPNLRIGLCQKRIIHGPMVTGEVDIEEAKRLAPLLADNSMPECKVPRYVALKDLMVVSFPKDCTDIPCPSANPPLLFGYLYLTMLQKEYVRLGLIRDRWEVAKSTECAGNFIVKTMTYWPLSLQEVIDAPEKIGMLAIWLLKLCRRAHGFGILIGELFSGNVCAEKASAEAELCDMFKRTSGPLPVLFVDTSTGEHLVGLSRATDIMKICSFIDTLFNTEIPEKFTIICRDMSEEMNTILRGGGFDAPDYDNWITAFN